MPYTNQEGLNLYYEQEGSGDPPLLFIHGWCCDHTFFQPQFDHFKAAHAVTTMDLRGCGSSDRVEDGYEISSMADDVARLCDELRIVRPVVVGHSWGGMIGIEVAARHPSVPAAVVALDPGPIDPTPQSRAIFEAFVENLKGADGEAVRQSWLERLFLPGDDGGRKHRIVETMSSVPLRVAVKMMRSVIAWNGVGALLLCKVPLMILLSQPRGSNAPDRLLALKPDVHIGITVGTGHFHQLEAPEQVTPMIERFLRMWV